MPCPSAPLVRHPVAQPLRPLAVAAAMAFTTALSATATAATAPVPAADNPCGHLNEPPARLACYDQLHGHAVPPDASPPAPTRAASPATPAATPATAGGPATPVPPTPTDAAPPSHLGRLWDLPDRTEPRTLFAPYPYQPVYLLPATWSSQVNRLPQSPSEGHVATEAMDLLHVEAKYQLSFKSKLGQPLPNVPLTFWGAYTQSSRWQVYNGAISRPFRETNYEPEIIATWPMGWTLPGGSQLRMGSLALNHQSNGRSLPLSRSWNRLITGLAFEGPQGNWTVELRPWWRLPERASDDDNPDVGDYLGRGELVLHRYFDNRQHALRLQLRHSLRGGTRNHGSLQADWAFPLSRTLARSPLHGYLQVFTGYGESLVDYNVRQTKIGLGVTIAGWE